MYIEFSFDRFLNYNYLFPHCLDSSRNSGTGMIPLGKTKKSPQKPRHSGINGMKHGRKMKITEKGVIYIKDSSATFTEVRLYN